MPSLPSSREAVRSTFPPVTKEHILNCSYDSWFPSYRSSCLKSRIIPLPSEVVSYLLEDGIVLADDEEGDKLNAEDDGEWHSAGANNPVSLDAQHSQDSDSDSEGEDAQDVSNQIPPNRRFPHTHALIQNKINELGGAVVPKLNWSSPKDAKWISPHQNTLKCTSPNDIYLLLKSSLFVSHDLVHTFDDCAGDLPPSRSFKPVLVLRPFFSPHVAMEFRCFVKHRTLIGICQRDLNYYSFLDAMRPQLWRKIRTFFRDTLRMTFPDGSFAFDVYVPESSIAGDGLGKVRLIDINPWASRTDSLLFTWEELLLWHVEKPLYGSMSNSQYTEADGIDDDSIDDAEDAEDDPGAVMEYNPDKGPVFRIVEHDDPAAYNFSSSEYSAHKLPKEVVDASMAGPGGLRKFAEQWKQFTEGRAEGIWESQSS